MAVIWPRAAQNVRTSTSLSYGWCVASLVCMPCKDALVHLLNHFDFVRAPYSALGTHRVLRRQSPNAAFELVAREKCPTFMARSSLRLLRVGMSMRRVRVPNLYGGVIPMVAESRDVNEAAASCCLKTTTYKKGRKKAPGRLGRRSSSQILCFTVHFLSNQIPLFFLIRKNPFVQIDFCKAKRNKLDRDVILNNKSFCTNRISVKLI
ncbi:hypothetical protein LWI28_013937 [Acer negundo]|uniref:Uncharacterized protein n=1 Tax=Acer negundo TaxID=4023 RepID=A0AAD5ILU0_ACENE|nr:hypothetical protein LWI28_013937 [Acer negundo]